MFDKILIANRGEIACRIARTAHRLAIRVVAVHSDIEARAAHVRAADEAVAIGPAPVAESYLLAERIVEAAVRSGAQAVHPGYGFLAENAGFARACAEAGLVFIGPPPEAISAMGEKDAAKRAMQAQDVPIVPGYLGEDQGDETLAREAAGIGFPVLIKPIAGGGGKGMRVVASAERMAASLESARREAKSAFGDERVLLECYLERARHIEIQIFADARGNVVHLFERDCSLQRRHQKVVEEAPAPGMSAALRRAMGETAVTAARSIGYVGAGTVEFIADVTDGLREDGYYFMEMNTRLQVEHPVTEMVTGQDLVEWQLRVAAGEPLPLAQDEIPLQGHAVEARIYAEDPRRKFFPSSGPLRRLAFPAEGPNLRLDTGVGEGDEVTIYYDPMLAKMIAWDETRDGALRHLRRGLEATRLAGVANNVEFLAAIAGDPAFLAGDLDTGFIARRMGALLPPLGEVEDEVLAAAALDLLLGRREAAEKRARAGGDRHSPWARVDGWRLNDEGRDEVIFRDGEREIAIRVRYLAEGGHALSLPGGEAVVSGRRAGEGGLEIALDGRALRAEVAWNEAEVTVLLDGKSRRLVWHDPMALGEVELDVAGGVNAPLPGKILAVLVAPGAAVAKGDALMILEAMKMEHTIVAPGEGVVERVNVESGQQVEEGAELLSFEARED